MHLMPWSGAAGDDAEAAAGGGLEDEVDAVILDHQLGDFLALDGVLVVADIGNLDGDVLIDVVHAGDEAVAVPAADGTVRVGDEAHLLGLGGVRREIARDEGGGVRVDRDRADVRLVRLHVDVREDELGVRILGSHLDGQLGQVAPHAVDGVGAQLGHRADLILIFRLVERLNDLELGPGLGGQLLKALHAQRDERVAHGGRDEQRDRLVAGRDARFGLCGGLLGGGGVLGGRGGRFGSGGLAGLRGGGAVAQPAKTPAKSARQRSREIDLFIFS